jgi:hypothetical protein
VSACPRANPAPRRPDLSGVVFPPLVKHTPWPLPGRARARARARARGTPVNPPRRTPRLPATEAGEPRQTKRAARLGYRPNVSLSQPSDREAEAALRGRCCPPRRAAIDALFAETRGGGAAYNRIECFCERGISARASAPLSGFV